MSELGKVMVFILAPARSGTSALAGSLVKLGLKGPKTLAEAGAWNPKGFFESAHLRELDHLMLESAGIRRNAYEVPDEGWLRGRGREWLGRLKKEIQEEFRGSGIHLLKHPEISRVFPLYEEAVLGLGFEIKVVVAYRNPREVVNSWRARGRTYGEEAWVGDTLLSEWRSRSYQREWVSFNGLLKDWEGLRRLSGNLGLGLDFGRAEVVDEFLNRSILERESPKVGLGERAERVWELLGKVGSIGESEIRQEFDRLRVCQ